MDGENISELRVQLMPKTRRRMDAQKEEGVMAAINLSEASSAPLVFIRLNPYCEYIFMREQPNKRVRINFG